LGFKEQKETKKLRKHRGKKLREKFGITDDSPLKSRSLRDTWEHFDERLDVYLLKNDAGYFFPNPIIGEHHLADDPVGKVFKLLDPKAGCLVLLNNKFFYKPIKNEINKIFNFASSANKNGGRL